MNPRRRDNTFPEAPPDDGLVSDYKKQPLVSSPAPPPPLYSASCARCCPLSSSYLVDPVSPRLGLVTLASVAPWSLASLVLGWRYPGGVIVSPGQLEVARVAARSGAVIIIPTPDTRHEAGDSELLLGLALVTWHLAPVLVSIECADSWPARLLARLGVTVVTAGADTEEVEQLGGRGGLLVTPSLGPALRTLQSCRRPVLVAPCSLVRDGARARLELGLAMAVREMLGARDWDLAHVVHHCAVISNNLAKVTPSQLVAFVLLTSYCEDSADLDQLGAAVTEVTALLEARGVLASHRGEPRDVVRWGVTRLGGGVTADGGRIVLDLGPAQLWRLARGLELHFLADWAVGAAVMTGLGRGLAWCRPGLRTRAEAVTVGHQETADTAATLIQLLGEDRASLAPCQDPRQLVMEAMYRAEAAGSLVTVQEAKESARSEVAGGGDGQRTRYGSGWRREAEPWAEEDEGQAEDTRLVVGHTQRGRAWLDWVSGLMRFRVRNLYLTILALLRNKDVEIFTMEELEDIVMTEVNARKEKGWKESELTGLAEVTRKSVRALGNLSFVKIIQKGEKLQLVKSLHTAELEELLQVVLKMKC